MPLALVGRILGEGNGGMLRQIRSIDLLERLHREIKRRSDVVGIYPNREVLLRLVGSLLIEQNEEWAVRTADLTPRPGT